MSANSVSFFRSIPPAMQPPSAAAAPSAPEVARIETQAIPPSLEARPFPETPAEIGNKAYNLIRVRHILSLLDQRAAVPDFTAIASSTVQKYLSESAPKWRSLLAEFNTVFLKTQALQSDVLEKLQTTLENAFDNFPLPSWIQTKDPAALFMVRSTSKEDTKEVANPGGNTTVAAVKNDPREIRKAMGTVIASYFSEKSLTQRLFKRDDIVQEPLTPLLIQIMVGEQNLRQDPATITSCGVHFTQEMSGPTPGVSITQAALGHNEGVVAGLVAFDTYYRDSTGASHAVICDKNTRLVPQNGKLVEVDNPPERRKTPALKPEIQERLDLVGRAIAKDFGTPMDIEWIYDPVYDMLWIVQARPLETDPPPPSTLVKKSEAEILPSAEFGMIETPGASAVIIDDPKQIIRAKNIRMGLLDTYLKMSEVDRRQVKAILCEETSPGTSHEARVFRGEGIPAIVMPKGSTLPKGTKWILDVQRQKAFGLAAPIDPETVLEKGLFFHPISPVESLLLSREEIAEAKIANSAIKTFAGKTIPQTLLCLSEAQDKKLADAALAYLGMIVAKNGRIIQKQYPELVQRFQNIQAHFRSVSAHLMNLFDKTDRTEILLNLRWLEAVLMQNSKSGLVGQDSLYALLRIAQARKPIKPGEDLAWRISKYQLLPYADRIIHLPYRHNYRQFVKEIAQDSKLTERAGRAMEDLQDLGLLDTTLNIALSEPAPKGTLIAKLEQVTQQLTPADRKEIANIQRIAARAARIQADAMRDPKQSPDARRHFHELVILPMIALCEQSATLSPIVQNAISIALRTTAEGLDVCIKTIQNSQLANRESIAMEMILQFHALAKAAIGSLIAKNKMEVHYSSYLRSFNQWAVEVEQGFRLDPKQSLLPSPNFDVRAAVISARNAALDRHKPMSAEDLLTLSHQNARICSELLNDQTAVLENLLPKPLINLCDQCRTYTNRPRTEWNLAAVRFENGVAYIELNWPMQNHSAILKFFYANNQLKIVAEFYGHNGENRIEKMGRSFENLTSGVLKNTKFTSTCAPEQKILIAEWAMPIEEFAKRSKDFFDILNFSLELSFNVPEWRELETQIREHQNFLLEIQSQGLTDLRVLNTLIERYSRGADRDQIIFSLYKRFQSQNWKDLIDLTNRYDAFLKGKNQQLNCDKLYIGRPMLAEIVSCKTAKECVGLLQRLAAQGAPLALQKSIAKHFQVSSIEEFVLLFNQLEQILGTDDTLTIFNERWYSKWKAAILAHPEWIFGALAPLIQKGRAGSMKTYSLHKILSDVIDNGAYDMRTFLQMMKSFFYHGGISNLFREVDDLLKKQNFTLDDLSLIQRRLLYGNSPQKKWWLEQLSLLDDRIKTDEQEARRVFTRYYYRDGMKSAMFEFFTVIDLPTLISIIGRYKDHSMTIDEQILVIKKTQGIDYQAIMTQTNALEELLRQIDTLGNGQWLKNKLLSLFQDRNSPEFERLNRQHYTQPVQDDHDE